MFTTLGIVLPIFALVGVGYGCRKAGVLGPNASAELNRFVVRLALPAWLFDIMAHTSWAQLYQPGFMAAFGLSSAIVFGLTVAARRRARRPLADATLDGLNAGYANAGFIGLPLCLVAFGNESLAPATVATILTVCVLFAVAIVMIEIGLQAETRPLRLARKVGRSLIRNPLLVAPALGAALAATGLPVPASAETFLRLLGNAATPCALVALGLFLARQSDGMAGRAGSTLAFVALKLVLQPGIAWLLAVPVFGLSSLLTHIAVVMAAMPTGTGPFMLAEYYRREADVTSHAILISTIGSVVTVSAYLAWIA